MSDLSIKLTFESQRKRECVLEMFSSNDCNIK